MWQSLRTIVLAVALLMMLVLSATWARSEFVREEFTWWSAANDTQLSDWVQRCVGYSDGQLEIYYRWHHETGESAWLSHMNPGFEHHASSPSIYRYMDGPPPKFHRHGITLDWQNVSEHRADGSRDERYVMLLVIVPFWIVILAPGTVTTVGLVHIAQRRRSDRRGLCPDCGYDLRMTRERCPECGRVFAKAEELS
jgi:hypothetical protein